MGRLVGGHRPSTHRYLGRKHERVVTGFCVRLIHEIQAPSGAAEQPLRHCLVDGDTLSVQMPVPYQAVGALDAVLLERSWPYR